MTIEELSSVLQMQEEILQFSSFTNADAWELGNLIVAEAAKRGAAVLVRIRGLLRTRTHPANRSSAGNVR